MAEDYESSAVFVGTALDLREGADAIRAAASTVDDVPYLDVVIAARKAAIDAGRRLVNQLRIDRISDENLKEILIDENPQPA